MNNVQTAIAAIRNMTNDEINQVMEAIKMQRKFNAQKVTQQLTVGDTVSFDAKTRGVITGTVTKINPKTVQVRAHRTWTLWKVAASVLTIREKNPFIGCVDDDGTKKKPRLEED
jgi:hypothetical protein